MKLLATTALALAGIAACAALTNDDVAPKPNVLFILSDDHSTNMIGCYEGRLSEYALTPNIDRLASEGMRFANAFCTNSICVPSRASILTGQYSHTNGVYSLGHALDPEREHVGHLLQRAGYRTALIGKWHLKTDPTGFDHWSVLPGQGRYHDPVMRTNGSAEAVEQRGFSTDVITDLSLEWLRARDPDQPFCLMTNFKNCHAPWDWAERHGSLYEDVDIPEPPSMWEDKSHRSDGSREYGLTMETMAGRMESPQYATGRLNTDGMDPDERKRAAYQKLAKDYLRCVASIDENVGRLTRYLEDEGLLDETVVIYSSDQGFFIGEHDYIDKRWMFEESLRMPLVVRYPPEVDAGTTSDEIVLNVDFAETLLDYAGVTAPSEMQGASFRPLLASRGQAPLSWRTSMYYHYWQQGNRPAHYGVRTKTHKLIFFHGAAVEGMADKGAPATRPGWELYDLELDPGELRNVHGEAAYADVARELTLELDRLKDELGDRDEDHPEIQAARNGKRGA